MSVDTADANAEKLRTLRGLLAITEQRTSDPAGLAAVLELARGDGEVIAHRFVTMLARTLVSPEPTQEQEDAAHSILTATIGDRADTLRKTGAADNEALAYALAATIAAAEAIERAKAEVRGGLLH